MTVHIRVGLVAAARRRGATRIVRVIRVAGARRRVGIVDRGSANARRRAGVTIARVVVIASRRTTAVVVAARAVAARRTTTVVVVIRRPVAAATGGRTRPVALARALLLDLVVVRIRTVVGVGWLGWPDILNASDRLSLEFAVVELFDGVAEVVGSLVLNESGLVSIIANFRSTRVVAYPRPSRSRPTSE